MKAHERYVHGQWTVQCDVCGFDFLARDTKERWDGLRTCKEDWEPRHPQDFVRSVKDDQNPPFSRPDVAYIDFAAAPVILSQSGNSAPALGSTVTLVVNPDSALPLTFVWKFNTVAMNSSTNNSAASPVLVLTRFVAGQRGSYTCDVTNSNGTVTSAAIVLS